MKAALHFAEWFLIRAGTALLVGVIMAFFLSPFSPLTSSSRIRLSLLFSIACLGLAFVPHPMFAVGFHTPRIEVLLSSGVASAFGFAFALGRIRLAPKGSRRGGAFLALLHFTVLSLVIGNELR